MGMDVIDDIILEPGKGLARNIDTDQRLKILQVEGQQVADLISFNAEDTGERLSMYMSRVVNHAWKLTKNHVLLSTEARDMWLLEEDTVGQNYTGGGYCNRFVNDRRYERPDAPTCEDNFVAALSGYNLTRRSFDGDNCLNIFLKVDYRSDGSMVIQEPDARPDDYITLRSLMRQLVAISNCPQVLNPVNAYSLKPLRIQILG